MSNLPRKRKFEFPEDSSSSEDESESYDSSKSKRQLIRAGRRHCYHCDELVSVKTFDAHKRLYYNEKTCSWIPSLSVNTECSTDGESDSTESSSEAGCPSEQELQLEVCEASLVAQHTPFEWDDLDQEGSEPGEEQWDEEELSEFEGSECAEFDSEPEDLDEVPHGDVISHSAVLARWLALFLMHTQAIFHLPDAAVGAIIQFIKAFLTVLSTFCAACTGLAKHFPSSLYVARKKHQQQGQFKRFVVCRKCHKLYYIEDCVEGTQNNRTSKLCKYQRFPQHRQERMRAHCGCLLLKTVELASHKRVFYPFLTYCYMTVQSSLERLLNRPEFLPMCEKWRSRSIPPGHYADIYDGKIWKDFLIYDNEPFLAAPNNLALMLNVDFFQPYKHVSYSVGAVYFTVLNLPRSVRYKQENVILVGLIPGPHEPEHDVNTYLEPFVQEMLDFWDGVELSSYTSRSVVIRLALLCVACDIPGGRKVCGFLGHTANKGCSRCWKIFPGGVGEKDYSGFNRDQWQLRTGFNHRVKAERLRGFKTITEQERAESEAGCRYSVLLKLPYFDAPRMLIIDPMHNLFLGTAKHYLKSVLIGNGIVTADKFAHIQERVDSARVPAGMGRIPHKILSGFSSFTADQWKNWTCYFSLLALYDILKGDDMECWRHFVLACRVLTAPELTSDQVRIGDALLLQFCRRTQQLYGKEIVTPNMHLHCHLRNCIEDYGPLHSFWLYAFERYNGILGSTPNNNHCIEAQFMKRFVTDSLLLGLELPYECNEELAHHFRLAKLGGSLGTPSSRTLSSEWELTSDITLPSYYSRHFVEVAQLEDLTTLYAKLYSVDISSIQAGRAARKYTSIQLHDTLLGTHKSRTSASCIVMADWRRDLFGSPLLADTTASTDLHVLRPARVNSYLLHHVTVNGEQKKHVLACVSWFESHPKRVHFGKPLSVWCSTLFEPSGPHSIIPVHLIKHRTISIVDVVDDEPVLIVCPCVSF